MSGHHPWRILRAEVTRSRARRRMGMDLTDREHQLVLRGLFELRITHLEDTALAGEIDELAGHLGGEPDAMFYGAPAS